MDSMRVKMSSLTPFQRKHKVTIVGSGNWGSTIAKVLAENTAAHPDLFEKDVQMWVYEEDITLAKDSKHYDESSDLCTKPQKLTRLINHFHENVKYLPGIALPHNVIANPSITDSVKDSTILIFNLPHQFIEGLCRQLVGHILPFARGISCIKGVNVKDTAISLFSEVIGRELNIYCGALSGANIANEVAQEKFSETTIAYDPPPMDSQNPTPATSRGPSPASSHVDLTKLAHKDASGKRTKARLQPMPQEYRPVDKDLMKTLFHRRYFHVRVVSDVAGVSLGGALKNIVAIAAGFVDGLGWGDNAKAAVMRVGLLEMVDFGKRFFPKTVYTGTFTEESCGVADLITTCAGGRNHRCAKMSVQEGISIDEVEKRELNGQKLQGTLTANEVNHFLKSQGLEKEYPLFTAVYDILQGKANVADLPDLIEPSSSEMPQKTSEESSSSFPPPPPPAGAANSTTDIPPPDKSVSGGTAAEENTSRHRTSILTPPPHLATSRYARQLLLPSIGLAGQAALAAARVLIVGLGGLGCPAALYLAGAGVHTIGLVDGDVVEESNLHRQGVLYGEADVRRGKGKGTLKVDAAGRRLGEVNSEVRVRGWGLRLSTGNVGEVFGGMGDGETKGKSGWDVVLDCSDNPATRYLVSDACVNWGVPLISGAAQRGEGQVMVLNYPVGKGPCYRCVFPKAPAPEGVRACSEIGILGTVVGVIGTAMAGEVVRMVACRRGEGEREREREEWRPTLGLYNGLSGGVGGMWRSVGLRGRRRDCVVCGVEGVLREKRLKRIDRGVMERGEVDYEGWCGRVQDVRVLGEEKRVSAVEFLRRVGEGEGGVGGRKRPCVVDVREEVEYELGAKIEGSVNVPISKILRQGGGGGPAANERDEKSGLAQLLGDTMTAHQSDEPIYFVCQRGNDSQIAAERFAEAGVLGSKAWLGDVIGGFEALEKHVNG